MCSTSRLLLWRASPSSARWLAGVRCGASSVTVGERHRTIGEQVQNDRIPARRPRGFDSPVGRVLREVEHLRAVREERRAAFTEIEASRIEVGEQGHKPCGRVPLALRGGLHRREQLRVRQMRDGLECRHAPL